jgi:hypothetical protein
MATWKKVVVSGSNAELNTLRATSVTASLLGTASFATSALTASFALNAGATIDTSAFATTGSNTFVGNQIVSGAVNMTGVLTIQNAITTPPGQYFVASSDTSTELSWGVPFAPSIPVNAGIFTGPSGVGIGNTSTDSNGDALPTLTWTFAMDGTLTAPGRIQAPSFSGSFTGSLAGTSSFATSTLSASFATNASSSNFALTALSSSRAAVAGTVDSISGNITNNTDNRILTATGGGTINGEANLTFDGSTLALTGNQTVSGNVTVEGDLTVNGTTTTLNTQNLFVEDKFVLMASGSVSATDGGIVIAASASGVGYGFGYDASADRWALEDNLHATGSSFSATPTSYIVSAQSSTSAPAADPAYGGNTTGWGNIHVDTNTGEIFIYS